MHEYSITRSILDILDKIVKENKVKKLKRVNFEISSIAHIEPDSIKFYYFPWSRSHSRIFKSSF